ncbi:MAG: YdcF family protein [Caulobacterales bacterium]|nr:YdcF family protein [Caulobacterales bacterium]
MRRALIFGGLFAAIAFTIGFVAFCEAVMRLRPPDAPYQADGVVAFTGGSGARIAAAMDLLEQGQARRMLVSGVNPIASKAELHRITGGSAAMFDCCVDIGRAAQTTEGNAIETADWARAHAFGSLIVVTSDYHMPRALIVLRPEIGTIKLTPWPVLDPRADSRPWWSDATTTRLLLSEYVKYLIVSARGALLGGSPPPPEPAT